MEEWYKIKNINEVDSPALVVYPDRVKQNIALALSMVNDPVCLRPHVKTHKSPDVTAMMLKEGITKFKCATIAEAEMLAMAKAPDVLLAYQPAGPKIDRFIALIKKYPDTTFACLVDNKNIIENIASAAKESGVQINVYIDLNVGMNRTGIIPKQAAALYAFGSVFKEIEIKGLHVYDGHIRDENFETRKKQCDAAYEKVEQLQKHLIKEGYQEPIIIAGGSPTFSIHATRKNVECSPGTFVYWDATYLSVCKEQDFLPAALVITRVISLPNDTTVCTDLGHKSIAAENILSKRVHFLNIGEVEFAGQSEEHLVLKVAKDHTFKVGDVLYGLPIHVCPTCALYEKAITIENGMMSGEWKTVARDRKIGI